MLKLGVILSLLSGVLAVIAARILPAPEQWLLSPLIWLVSPLLAILFYLFLRAIRKFRLISALIHGGFALLLLGSLLGTHTETKGVIPLLPGDVSQCTYDQTGSPQHQLPFAVELKDFRVSYYPHSCIPQSFLSKIAIIPSPYTSTANQSTAVLQVNRPYVHEKWWLYQMSWGENSMGQYTVIEASKDRSLPIVLAGSLLTVLGLIGSTVKTLRS